MQAVICSFQSVSLNRGGVWTQAMRTGEALSEFAEVEFFDQWRNYDSYPSDTVFHVFTASNRTYFLCDAIRARGARLVTSPVFFREVPAWLLRAEAAIEHLWPRRMYTGNSCGKEICDWSEAVLPNSGAEAAYVAQAWSVPGHKLTVVPNGVEPRFRSADPSLFYERYGLRGFILGVGRLGDPRKHFDALARACVRLDVPCVLIGSLERTETAERITSLAAGNANLVVIGPLDHSDPLLESAYAAAHAVALPSDFETPGLACLEGALAGAHVLVTEVGGARDYFGNWAEYVQPRRERQLVDGLRRLLERPRGSELSDHVLQRFVWREVARQTAAAYARVGPTGE